jgi:putative MATE family efflux protein
MSALTHKKPRIGLDLTEGSIYRLLLTFATPIILTNIIQQLYSMVDLIIVGRFVGSVGTVGVSTGGELSDFLTPVASSVAMAGQIYIAQLVGSKDHRKTREVIGTLIAFMMIASAVCMIAPIIFYVPILNMLNCPEEAFAQATQYMIITALGMPFIFGYNVISAILRGMGESKRPLQFITIAAVTNIVLDMLLVAVIPLEAAGSAIATVFSQIGAFGAAFYYMYRRREQFDFRLELSYFKINARHLKVILKLGIPQLIRVFCVRFSMLWVKANVNDYGLLYSATYSVGNKIEKFIEVFIMGINGAAGAMIGQNLGARKHERVKGIMRATLAYSIAFGVFGALMFLLLPRQLFRLFTSDVGVIEYGVLFMQIMAAGLVISAASGAYKSIATGSGAAGLCFAIGLLDGACRIAVCLLAVHVFSAGVIGYFWGAALCQLIPGLVCLAFYLTGKWRKIKLLSEE